MANMLIQEHIQKSTSPENESLLAIKHRVDEGLFFYKQDSADFLNILQRFATEPQMSHSSSQNLVGTNSVVSSSSSFFLSTNENYEKEKINVFGVDQVEAIIKEDKISHTLDNILASAMVDAFNRNNMFKSYSDSRLCGKIHFQNRKRVASISRMHESGNETEITKVDSTKQITNNQDDTQEHFNETHEKNKSNSVKKEKDSNSKSMIPQRFRRKFGFRSPNGTPWMSFEPTFENETQIFASNAILSSAHSSTPTLPSSLSSSSNESVPIDNPSILTDVLRRTCRVETKKKTVRFADSIGCELEQVKYIQSETKDDLTNLSTLKHNFYLLNACDLEPKSWIFDVESKSTESSHFPVPKRFFRLYRQPNAKEAEVYLNEILKYQIKLEYACMCLKFSLTGEQCLYGTVWVTNPAYHKNVTIQYTFDHWLNKYEYEAQYCCHSNDSRNMDQFEFNIDISYDVDRIDFALCYRVNGQENWDNNGGQNYTLETESVTPNTTVSFAHDYKFNEVTFY